jgi:hypothetical protein
VYFFIGYVLGLPDVMLSFQNFPNFGKFCGASEWKVLLYDFKAIRDILRPFDIGIVWPYGNFEGIWYILSHFGTFYKENLATLMNIQRFLRNLLFYC